ncbi:hypothetical protein [Chitinophaga agri]|uniref:Uncharacterized protein n=1 Tax=Chitinophaga agri TaxID=2703787 RepID=A0A6B9ZCF9_9BACT|nr:hypothetical protein [Chitinophaga agri]QHS59847.1 hypothetical protein GWR21_09675 [Chitinophaga agri]
MKTIKFSIEVNAIDSYIYSGHIFLVLIDGRLVFAPLSKIMWRLVSKYPEFENLLRLSFQRNDYLSNKQSDLFWGVGQLRNVFAKLWEKATEEIDFLIEFNEEDFKVISEIPSMPVLDMKLYAMRMYVGCKEGLYEILLNPEEDKYTLHPSKPEKRFDVKVTNLNAKSGEVIISANNDGLFHGSFLNERNKLRVEEKAVANKSIRTGWSSYDVINYDAPSSFEYFVNETTPIKEKPAYSKFDEFTERKRITEFGKSKFGVSQLLERSNIRKDDISYCFNSSGTGFFFLKDGRFVNINLNKDDKTDLYFKSRTNDLPTLESFPSKSNRPISTCIVPRGCVVEFFDKVVLYQNSKAKVIETSPTINIRTYPSSIRYKNLISVTKDDYITLHSIYPFVEETNDFRLDTLDFE